MLTPAVIDAADPRSLAEILPVELAEKVRELPAVLLEHDEVTLSTLVNPSDQQKRLKIQFWDEYELANRENRHLILSNIVFGVCTKEYFSRFLERAVNVAWLVTPRPSYKIRIAELIEKGLDQVEKIFLLEPNKDGTNAVSIGQLKLSALRMLDMRKHGGYTQRIEQKSLVKEIKDDPKTQAGSPTESSVEELEAEVAELERRIRLGKNQNGALLDVTPVPVLDVNPRMDDGSKAPTSSEV